MSDHIDIVRVIRTGALIRLHDQNMSLLTNRNMVRSTATVDPETGSLTEIVGADHIKQTVASNDLARIGKTISDMQRQCDNLIASAIALPNGEPYLKSLGIDISRKPVNTVQETRPVKLKRKKSDDINDLADL